MVEMFLRRGGNEADITHKLMHVYVLFLISMNMITVIFHHRSFVHNNSRWMNNNNNNNISFILLFLSFTQSVSDDDHE